MRERNRIAQKRYRMRQREKLEEARAEIAALKQQLAEATLKQQLADATAAQVCRIMFFHHDMKRIVTTASRPPTSLHHL